MAAADLIASRRYAKALFQLALGRNEVDEIADSLRVVTEASKASPQLMVVLHHPRITRERKKELIHQMFGDSVREDVEHFLSFLVDKDRANVIPTMARQFLILVDEHRREADAEAVSAVPLTEAQIAALKTRLEAQTGYKLRLTTRVDEKILGGLVVRVGDHLIDGSLATELSALRERLKKTKVA